MPWNYSTDLKIARKVCGLQGIVSSWDLAHFTDAGHMICQILRYSTVETYANSSEAASETVLCPGHFTCVTDDVYIS